MLSIYLNITVAGCLTGLIYGLMALGLSVIFGVLRVVNFAHGEMMVVGMFGAYLGFRAFGLDPMMSVPVMAAILFLAGYALQRGLVNRYVTMPDHIQFLLLLAVGMVITSSNLMVFGPDAHNVPLDYAFDSVEVGPLLIDKVRVYAASAAVALTVLLWLFFRYTMLGKAIRACADNQVGAQVIGLNVMQLYAVTFGLGAACVGAAGALMLLLVDVQPFLASDYTLLAFIIVILGGLGSFGGALLGGVLVGLSEALSGFLIAPSMKSLFSFALLILVLLLRPQGLMGART